MVAKGEEGVGGMDWVSEVSRRKLLHTELMDDDKVLLNQ